MLEWNTLLSMSRQDVHLLHKITYYPNQPKGTQPIAIIPRLSPLILHGITIGKGAKNMAEKFVTDPKDAIANQREVLKALGMAPLEESFLILTPKNGDINIFDVTNEEVAKAKARPNERPDVETVIHASFIATDRRGIPLLTKAADCPTVFMHAKGTNGQNVIALLHSGRDETEYMAPTQAISHLQTRYGCDPQMITLGVAPSIGMSHYPIKKKNIKSETNPQGVISLENSFWKSFMQEGSVEGENVVFLDVCGNVIAQFLEAGVHESNIYLYDLDIFALAQNGMAFSHRYSQQTGFPGGRIMVVAQL